MAKPVDPKLNKADVIFMLVAHEYSLITETGRRFKTEYLFLIARLLLGDGWNARLIQLREKGCFQMEDGKWLLIDAMIPHTFSHYPGEEPKRIPREQLVALALRQKQGVEVPSESDLIPASDGLKKQQSSGKQGSQLPSDPVPANAAATSVATAEDVLVEETVVKIRALALESAVGLAIKVGELIITTFYGGDVERWRQRGPQETSFRKLSARFATAGEDGFSAVTLCRSVGLYIMSLRRDLTGSEKLSLAILRPILHLPEEEQDRLLEEIEDGSLPTGGHVEKEAAKVRKQIGNKRGRRPIPAIVRKFNDLESAFAQARTLERDVDEFSELDEVTQARIRRIAENARSYCETFLTATAKLEKNRA
ncbi:MAG: hypothetical protein WC802_02410 [Patescibacteria group bacterium]|jgi:hypothetical protein